ncbi:DJ-1/PfpI family protein [Natronorarus salvus]|uniref:DJ-1/PfpI family protein n=1 Tax=Natronorarus salvus TaxID=3117733 RepID=UPI002F268FA3
MDTTVAIVLYEGFDELDAIGPYEVVETARAFGGEIRATLGTLDPVETVTASHGLRVAVDGTLSETEFDVLLVPGGGWSSRPEHGAWGEAERGDLPQRIAVAHEEGATVASVCTGGMLLSRAGVLDGRPATTHASALADLRETDAEVVEARVVDDGDVLTAGGVTSGLDLALHLVERECGAELAERVATELEYDRREVYSSRTTS